MPAARAKPVAARPVSTTKTAPAESFPAFLVSSLKLSGWRRIENINAAAQIINYPVCPPFGRVAGMNMNPRLASLIVLLALLLPVLASRADEVATVSSLAGQWHGTSRFTGISYAEATQKKVAAQDVATALTIAADGRVTGHVGGAELGGCVVEANRGWFGRLLHIKTDFIIRGKIIGAVVPGSESGTHAINAPFNLDGARIAGTLFVKYPIKYPYPFLSLRLSRLPTSTLNSPPD
jgi:hypothetical protein